MSYFEKLFWLKNIKLQIEATEQYFDVFFFKHAECDLSDKSYWAIPLCGTVYYTVQGRHTFVYYY